MATKKDLVEAYSFSRRRLITAFVSGAPGGREVEPARPGRTVVGGVALSVLLVAGAAITGIFAPTAPTDWKDPGLIISTDNGESFVIIEESDDPELRPVINATSATLILGADAATPTMLDKDTIDEQRIGGEVGILGAPSRLPTSSLLVDSGWTACTADRRGIRVRVDESPDVTPAIGQGVTVENGGLVYVVVPNQLGEDSAHVHLVPKQMSKDGPQTDNLLRALNLPVTESAVHVSRDWLNLFPVGAPLDWSSFDLEGWPGSAPYGEPGQLKIGGLLETDDGDDLLVTQDGLLTLDAFQSAVYRNVVDPRHRVVEPDQGAAPPVDGAPDDLLAANLWPEVPPDGAAPVPCAQLTTEHGEAPVVQLVTPGDLSGADDVAAGEKDQVVGRGAYVLSGGWADTDQGSPFVIDSKGLAYPLVGEETATYLGYGDFPVVVVPDTWIKLFGCGVNLSQDAALSAPEPDEEPSCGD